MIYGLRLILCDPAMLFESKVHLCGKNEPNKASNIWLQTHLAFITHILGPVVCWTYKLWHVVKLDRDVNPPSPMGEGGTDTVGWRRAQRSALINHTGPIPPLPVLHYPPTPHAPRLSVYS